MIARLPAFFYKKSNELKFKSNNTSERFVEGFVTTSLLYCVGPIAIMGALKEGLSSITE
jgi:uncharacterized membrane protein YqgA involved in biofilm formation